jgi:urea transport system substrate-binding protein
MNLVKNLAGKCKIAALLTSVSIMGSSAVHAAEEIKVGVLFSQTGGLSIVEKSLASATLMAIDEINEAGGVKGMMIKPVLEDGASDPKTFNEKASKLVIRDRVATVFGGYTSASRKAILPVIEKRKNLLFYPTFYEGFECSKNVVYTGSVPNQQLNNYIPYLVNTLGKKKFFIVGSNYLFPKEMAKVAKKLIEENGAEWVGDEYLELGHSEWGSMVKKIKDSGADIVLSNVVGDSIISFYREYANQGISQADIPIASTVTSEIEVAALGGKYAAGSYTSFPYFQAIDTEQNKAFIKRYRAYTKDASAVTHHAMESAYSSVYLWAAAVEKSEKVTPSAIRDAVKGVSEETPSGLMTVSVQNLHSSMTPRIAQWKEDGQGVIVDEFDGPVLPLPYSAYGETAESLFCSESGLDSSKL